MRCWTERTAEKKEMEMMVSCLTLPAFSVAYILLSSSVLYYFRCIQMLLVMCNPLQVRNRRHDKEWLCGMKLYIDLYSWVGVDVPAGTWYGWSQLQCACGEPDTGARHYESATPQSIPALQPNQRQARPGAGTQNQCPGWRWRQIW